MFGAFGSIAEVMDEGSYVRSLDYATALRVMRGIAEETLGFSYPTLLFLRYYYGVADGWRVAWRSAAATVSEKSKLLVRLRRFYIGGQLGVCFVRGLCDHRGDGAETARADNHIALDLLPCYDARLITR